MKDIEELTVGDAMTYGIICIDPEDTVLSAAEIMAKNDISGVIVTKGGEGVGVLTERDIICKIVSKSKDPKKTIVSEVMTSPLITIKPDSSIDDAARIMRDKDIRRLVVKDKGRIIGVLSEFDIVKLEPALHLLIKEQASWEINDVHAASVGGVSGICESCDNYMDSLKSIDGRLLCEDCTQ